MQTVNCFLQVYEFLLRLPQIRALHLLGSPAHEPPVVAVKGAVRRVQQALLVVAQQEMRPQACQSVVHRAAFGAEVDVVAQGDDVAAALGSGVGQHGLQRGEVAVDIGEDQGAQADRLLSAGWTGVATTVTPG